MPGAIEKLGFSIKSRQMLFYGVCIPLRLFIVFLAMTFYKNFNFQLIALILSGISIFTNISRMGNANDPVWWNRMAHLLFSVMGASTIVLGKPQFLFKIILLDILFGVIDSFIKMPFVT